MIIAICGLQNSGKDTLGSILVKKYNFTKLSFADVLKDVIASVFRWDRNLLEGSTKESREWREQVDEWWSQRLNIPNLTPRFILQQIGTELFRNHFHEDIWVAAVEKQLSLYDNVVITDCRFPNEAQMLQNKGAKFVKITRGELPKWFYEYENNLIAQPSDIHPSEYLWIKNNFDYCFDNSGSILDLVTFAQFITQK